VARERLAVFDEGEKMSWTRKLFGGGGGADEVETVRIGSQVWMTRNFVSHEGTASADPEWDAAKYGTLFAIDDAIRSAPKGWHLPTKEEWELLSAMVMRSLDSKKLLMKDFHLVLKDDHAWFWTATRSSTGAHALVAETSKYNWQEGNYGFALVTKNCDLYRCPARYVHD
jgi:uncharacterized protein (TIGR02145 family)